MAEITDTTDITAATTTTTTTAPPQEKPAKAELKRWGDEEDDPVEESTASSSSQDKVVSELNVDALTIDDNKNKINEFLEEPEDSHITAVPSLSKQK